MAISRRSTRSPAKRLLLHVSRRLSKIVYAPGTVGAIAPQARFSRCSALGRCLFWVNFYTTRVKNGGAERATVASGVTLTPDELGAVRPLRFRAKLRHWVSLIRTSRRRGRTDAAAR